MLDMKDLKSRFKSPNEYDFFCREWAKACYRLNPTERNKEELERSKKISQLLGVRKERE